MSKDWLKIFKVPAQISRNFFFKSLSFCSSIRLSVNTVCLLPEGLDRMTPNYKGTVLSCMFFHTKRTKNTTIATNNSYPVVVFAFLVSFV